MQCSWMKQQLVRTFEIQPKVIGLGTEEVPEEGIVQRCIQIMSEVWKTEADKRHADIIIENLNLQEATGVSSLCQEDRRRDNGENVIVA